MPALPVRRALLAEDDDALREIVRRALESLGFQAQAFSQGDEALEACRAEPPELLVTDILMPGLRGTELVQRLRDEKIEVPALIISTEIDEAARRLVERGPKVAVLMKPFALGDFQGAIRALLDQTG